MPSLKNAALLVIDAQIDFMDVPNAALPVKGAVEDMRRLNKCIENINPHSIFSSMDSHYAMDIAHPRWWVDKNGNFVDIYTQISVEDVENGKYTPRIDPLRSLQYLKDLAANGEFKHTIWPEHCLIGSAGHALHPEYFDTINNWMVKNTGRWVNFIRKGVNPFTEHFGIFRANVPDPNDSTTNYDQRIFKTMNDHDVILLAGEARSHCVANSLKQMLENSPQLASKIIVLEDCMSNVVGLPDDFYVHMEKIYSNAIAMGVRVQKSTDF